jgi:transcriptional regulator with XRE-family HTH domain
VPTEDLERELGERIRAVRMAGRLTQVELADRANVSVGALKNLESGSGSSTSTLVKVLRALSQESWLDKLEPRPLSFNPLEVLEARRRESAKKAAPRRVRRTRRAGP